MGRKRRRMRRARRPVVEGSPPRLNARVSPPACDDAALSAPFHFDAAPAAPAAADGDTRVRCISDFSAAIEDGIDVLDAIDERRMKGFEKRLGLPPTAVHQPADDFFPHP